MSDMDGQRSSSNVLMGLLAAALVLSIGGLIWCFTLQGRLADSQKQFAQLTEQDADLKARLAATDARLRATSETLGQSLGLTQKQLELKSDAILARQQADTARLERTEAANAKQIGQVSTEVSTVKTDVGGVKTDVANTRSDLEATKTQLQRTMGDAGVMSGLIAKNHDELQELRRRGERNYFEFTLHKGEKPMAVSTITLQLKKVDNKRGKFTLMVNSDDRNIEKKDKNLDEPVQFYTGKSPSLYEIVVNNMDKNVVSGYLSTPKG